jgi:hypothetical protein
MTPEQYLAQAKESAAASDYAAATAYASIAAAEAAVATMQASTPPALYPGKHAPALIEWCGKCGGPGHRVKRGANREQMPCKACSYQVQPEVRPCRYCQAYIQTDAKSRGVRTTTWTDARGIRWCPKAPDPSDPQSVTEETDPTPSYLWTSFLQVLYGIGELMSTDQIIARHQGAYYFPVTRYDQVPAQEQLERWFEARLGQPHLATGEQAEYRLLEKTWPGGDRRWTASREACS